MKWTTTLLFLISGLLAIQGTEAFMDDIVTGITEDIQQVITGIMTILQRLPWARPQNKPSSIAATTTDHENSAIIVEAAPERQTIYVTETKEIEKTVKLTVTRTTTIPSILRGPAMTVTVKDPAGQCLYCLEKMTEEELIHLVNHPPSNDQWPFRKNKVGNDEIQSLELMPYVLKRTTEIESSSDSHREPRPLT